MKTDKYKQPAANSPNSPLTEVLQALRQSPEPLSGEALAARLGLSRAAVWKRINRLKAQGYAIVGSPRRGYRLAGRHRQAAARGDRPGSHRPGVSPVRCTTSTRWPPPTTWPKSWRPRAPRKAPWWWPRPRPGGRGRLGRQWDSPPGTGLYVSLLLRPPLPPTEMPQITLTTAVAVARAVKRVTGVAPGIKWPNDLLLDGKKLGGILTEMETESEQIRHLVVGLGLNVNNPAFPEELQPIATSLVLATGRRHSRLHILQAWLEEFEELYDRFLAREFAGILHEWRRLTVTLGQRVTVRQGPVTICGQALEVAPDGALLVETDDGEVVRVTSGEIAV